MPNYDDNPGHGSKVGNTFDELKLYEALNIEEIYNFSLGEKCYPTVPGFEPCRSPTPEAYGPRYRDQASSRYTSRTVAFHK